ncbi:MAG: phosphoglycerate dehydrogenase [Thermoguttaceae bacterium]|nr:phosphoglycerate dehydrogenase [Thermoguttaceae bacterium]
MPKLVVLDNLSEDGLNLMKSANVEYEVHTGLKGDELRECLMNFDGAICRSGVKITADVLEGNKRLKAIARAGVGVDNIDLKAATRRGIIVMNTPGGNTESTAEQTFALILALSRNIHPAYQSLIEGRWDRKKFTGHQLGGKTLGIIGMGRIGQVVTRFAKAFEMNVLAFDPFLTAARAKELGVTQYEKVEDMLPFVDYLTVHTPLNDATRNLIDTPQIALLKQGACLINCARGGIYNMDALVEGLNSGKLGGVAIDVYPEEPCTSHPLFGMPHVVCTPHLGASTEEAQTNVALEAVQLLIDYFTKGIIRQAVNFSSLDPETLHKLRSSFDLAYRMGILAGQVADGAVTACKLKYKGEISQQNISLISSAFAAGLLTDVMDEEVGVVSALPLLKERGIELIEEKSSEVGDFRSIFGVEITTDKGSTTCVAGSLFGNAMPRLIQYNSLRLESYLDGNLLVFFHHDVPGVIANIGGILAKQKVNIAHMCVGRGSKEQGGTSSIGILSLDAVPSAETVKEINSLDQVTATVAVKLPMFGQHPSWMN